MESKKSDLQIPLNHRIAIRCSRAALMLSAIRSSSSGRIAPATDRDHQELERIRRSEADLKAALARELAKKRQLVRLGKIQVVLLVNLVVLGSFFVLVLVLTSMDLL